MAEFIQKNQGRSATLNQAEAPLWARYAGDFIFLLIFLVVFFFMKPGAPEEHDETDDQEAPNPLEAVLLTEPDEDGQKNPDSEQNDSTDAQNQKQGK